jgi:hypothetical protein
MEDHTKPEGAGSQKEFDLRGMIRSVIEEFAVVEKQKHEPTYKHELAEEKRRREQLEKRLNDLAEENRRNRIAADEAERASQIRSELQRLGVSKVDLAFRVVKDDILRAEDGKLIARTDEGEKGVKEYLTHFVKDNPEFLPARIAGGSGVTSSSRGNAQASASIDIEKIRPGMSEEELRRVRDHIALVASQTLRGE